MKNIKLLSFIVILLTNFGNDAIGLESASSIPPATQPGTFVLPSIRRVGLEVVDTNVDEFRVFMRKQDGLLYGVPAQPYNESDIRRNLVADLEEEIQKTGRFWTLSFSDFIRILPLSNVHKNVDNTLYKQKESILHEKLVIDYSLDSWIKASVYFSPDETLVRIILKGTNLNSAVWAREDVLIRPQATEEQIRIAFSQAITRLIGTIGHDGKLTYARENLVTIDYGKEIGVGRGDFLYAGFVTLESFHPQTGEFLRANRIVVHKLKALDVHEGSSLCQIVETDRTAFEQALALMGKNSANMLSWRQDKREKSIGWREPYNPVTAPILGSNDEGFSAPLKQSKKQEEQDDEDLPKSMLGQSELNTQTKKENKSLSAPLLATKVVQNDSNQGLVENNNSNKSDFMRMTGRNRAHLALMETWETLETRLGLGMTQGEFVGGSSSGMIQSTLFNRVSYSGLIDIDSDLDLRAKPEAAFNYFNSGDLKGNTYYASIGIYNTVWNDRNPESKFSIGGSLKYMGGFIDSDLNKTETWSHLGLFFDGIFESKVPQFGLYNLAGGFSVFDYMQGIPVWYLQANVRAQDVLPKELGFDAQIRRIANSWIEMSLGVSWDFLPAYTRSSKVSIY